MTLHGLIRSLTAAIAVALAVSACATGDPPGNGAQNGDPPIAQADLIVPGERIGDLPAIGTAGSVVRAMDFDNEVTVDGGARAYQWLDDASETVWVLFVCPDPDQVTAVYIYDKPGNERFSTAEGVRIASSEADVIAALGEPDRIGTFLDNWTLGYFTVDGVPRLTINYKVDALYTAWGIWVSVGCDL